MISRKFKDEISRIIRPAALFLKAFKIRPNHLTAFGFICSLVAAVFYGRGLMRLGGFILLMAGFGDVLDGCLARSTGKSSRFGAFIDSVTDRYSEFMVFFGILFWLYREQDTVHLIVLLAALMGSIMVSYTRARAESIIGECQVGLMERPERVLILVFFSLIGFIRPALWILAAGANATALQRVIHTYKATEQ